MNKLRKSIRTVAWLVILIALVIMGWWFVSRLGSGQSADLTDFFTAPDKVGSSSQKLPSKDIFNENSLENDGRFRQLQDFRQEEIEFGKKGRSNPFVKP